MVSFNPELILGFEQQRLRQPAISQRLYGFINASNILQKQ
jgi:hypothetical protein